ncbi:NagC family transcriptional regulator [Cellulomonas soli]|uniref:NagC family transcriptional regulator n=2 Tax=Cellulomonas soli TaxID=931535 RepID=A0A512PAW9_9CELL|nr:ROK family protein [Cellulomonas soli]NYI57359.1 putative NBD/HSP70 family sugar kinase [Cellulomonas soli]GEP68361.1 NagC family transcriptional regulator [Cellulomonas soli]
MDAMTTPPPPGGAAGAWSVGLDVGGTKVQAVLLDEHGGVHDRLRVPTRRGLVGVAGSAAEAVDGVLRAAGVASAAVRGVGVGLPGVVDPRRGTVENAVNLGITRREPFATVLQTMLGGLPVLLENDLNAAVLGAAHVLDVVEGQQVDDLAFLALGTGLAAGLLLHGDLRRGARRAAGEIGHLIYVPGGLPCPCGQRGCLEQYASGSALDAAWPSTSARPAPVELFEAAAGGDERALAVRETFVRAVVAAIRVLVLTCDPERIVVGGGVSELGEPLLEAIVAELDRQARTSPFLATTAMTDRIRLVPPGLPVGAVGAALVFRAPAEGRTEEVGV